MTADGHAHCINDACPSKAQSQQNQQATQQGENLSIPAVVFRFFRWLKRHLFELRANLRGFGGTGNALVAGVFSTILLAAIAAIVLPKLPFPLIAESGVVIIGVGLTVFAMLNAERRKGGHRGLPAARRAWIAQLAVVPVTTIAVFIGAVKLGSGALVGTALLAVVAMTFWGRKLVQFEANKTDLEVASLGTYQHQGKPQPGQPAVSAPVAASSPAVDLEDERPAFDAGGFPVDPYAPKDTAAATESFVRLQEPATSASITVSEPDQPATTPEVSGPAPDIMATETVEEIMADMDKNLVGMEEAKKKAKRLIFRMELAKEDLLEGKEVRLPGMNMILLGPSGTGKTTFSEFWARLLRACGRLNSPEIFKVDSSSFTGAWQGHPEKATNELLDRSDGKVLLWDEFYNSLTSEHDDFGHKAMGIFLNRIERERDSRAVIIAGYEDQMRRTFKLNSGIESRFPTTIVLPAYSADQLSEIFRREVKRDGYKLLPQADHVAQQMFKNILDSGYGDLFGNARGVRNVVDGLADSQAERLQTTTTAETRTSAERWLITPEDVHDAYVTYRGQSGEEMPDIDL
jgi:Cdc6-like AAA superfamily ATPase